MNFDFTDEQEELRATARTFLADRSASEDVRRAMESGAGSDPSAMNTTTTAVPSTDPIRPAATTASDRSNSSLASSGRSLMTGPNTSARNTSQSRAGPSSPISHFSSLIR